jgi:hypothetical protein
LSSDDPSLKATPNPTLTDPDTQEVAPGANHQKLEGWVPELASPDELRTALEHAFDYRGDVLITCKDGTTIEGYIFDRRPGRTLEDSLVRILPKNGAAKKSVRYTDIAALAFSGRDMAAGKNWETWVRQYWERKSAGEKSISLQPDELE